jgi:hypothetical protein
MPLWVAVSWSARIYQASASRGLLPVGKCAPLLFLWAVLWPMVVLAEMTLIPSQHWYSPCEVYLLSVLWASTLMLPLSPPLPPLLHVADIPHLQGLAQKTQVRKVAISFNEVVEMLTRGSVPRC